MGSWKLEAFKMVIYMGFPVGCFWLFNTPGVFEKWIMERRGLLFTNEDPKTKEKIQEVIDQLERQKQGELEEQMRQLKLSRSSKVNSLTKTDL